jgi:hypothetical protein
MLHLGPADAKDGAVPPDGRPRAPACAGQGQCDRARPFRRGVPPRFRRGPCRVDARPREALGEPDPCAPARARLLLAPSRMLQMRLDPNCRRGVPALWLPASAPAQGHCVRRWRPGAGRSAAPRCAVNFGSTRAHALARDADPDCHRARLQVRLDIPQVQGKFGIWPATRSAQPMQPSPEVLSWVRSRIIAYAKAEERAA